ncbi:MAG: alcohol dehydrogenase catalytic domain-containing protein [Candidatus Hydrogenedentota bacterium]
MKALVLDGEAQIQDVPIPERPEGESLIRVVTAGVCNTDLELLKGYMNFAGTLGHEFVGIVERSDIGSLIGKRVVGEINCVCQTCDFCQREMPNHCANRTVLGILNRHGAFAEYLTLPDENLHVVPDGIEDDIAVFTEPLAAAHRILEQVEIEQSDRVIILGAGKLGQLIAQVLNPKTKHLLVVGKNDWKLEILKDLKIATADVYEPLQRNHADFVVDATGSYEGFTRAIELVRPEGTIVLKTTITHPTALEMSVPVINEIRVIGSRCGPFRPALESLASNAVAVGPLVSETYELSDAVHALQRARAREVMKVLIQM